MKQIMSIALVAALMGGSLSAQAAVDNTKKVVTKKAMKKIAKKSNKAKAGMVKAAKATAPVVAAAPATAQSISKVSSSAVENPLSLSARIENEYEGKDLKEKGVRTGTSYLYLQASYKVDSNTSFKINQELTQGYEQNVDTNRAERTKAAIGDTYLQLTKTKLFNLASLPVDSYIRTYLPTSIATRVENNQYLEVRGELSATVMDQGIFKLSAHTHGRAYLGENYKDALDDEGNLKVNKKYRLRNYLTANLSFTDKLYFLQQLGVQHTVNKDATGGQPGLYAYSEIGYQVTPSIGLELAAYSLKPMNTVKEVALYSAKGPETLYYLNGAFSF